ncbi:VanW family protein [Lachnospiraceae bacterium JLR.KK008]
MKKWICAAAGIVAAVACIFVLQASVKASENGEDYIHNGIFIGDIDVSGMTKEEASAAVQTYIDSLKEVPITLNAVGGNQVTVTAGDMGIAWENQEVLDDAFGLGKQGNIIKRYKALKDLERNTKKYEIALAFDSNKVNTLLTEQCTQFDVQAEDAHLRRENGQFIIEGGQTGEKVDVAASVEALTSFLQGGWNKSAAEVDLVVVTDEPRGNKEDLEQVKDVLGTFTTSYSTSGADRSANVANGCSLINETTLYPGEEFSAYEKVSPFSEENGYHLAGSYLNGMVVESLGGGICQVSTTLYNAVLLSELEVTERHNHSMEVSYVQPSADAAIAESAGKDFKFVNNTQYPIYIEGHTEDKKITFTIYGVETRDPGRTISFESEILSETRPDSDAVIADGGMPIGYVKVQSVHVGRSAKLWKVTKENGQEVSREEVNSSSYKMVPRTATVGTATADPVAAQLIQDAIATNNIDHIKGVAAALKAGDTTLGGTIVPPVIPGDGTLPEGVVPPVAPEVPATGDAAQTPEATPPADNTGVAAPVQ